MQATEKPLSYRLTRPFGLRFALPGRSVLVLGDIYVFSDVVGDARFLQEDAGEVKRTKIEKRGQRAWLQEAWKLLAALIAGILLTIFGYYYVQYREQNPFTVEDVRRFDSVRVGVGEFWFDEDRGIFASVTSHLRMDGVEVMELPFTPDRKIARGLHYKSPEDLYLFESVPLPNHRPCVPEPLDPIEARELRTWQELVSKQKVDVLILGEVIADLKTIRLWIGSLEGPQSLVLPITSQGEISEAARLAKVAVLMAVPQVMERRLHLDRDPNWHRQRVEEAIRSLNHTLTWGGIDKDSRLAMEVTRARLHVNLLIHGHEVSTEEVEGSFRALWRANAFPAPCGSVSAMYDQDEAVLAVVLTRRTESDLWHSRALAAFERVNEKAQNRGDCGAAGISRRMINRLLVERGLRMDNPEMIEEGFTKLEEQYARLPLCDSPALKIMLPDAMIVLYRQAADKTSNEKYRQRAEDLWILHKRNFPKGPFERPL